jgi:hypothetical protein
MPPPPPTAVAEAAPIVLLPTTTSPPRLVLYAQTHHQPDGSPISLLPLITQNTGATHVIVAALHINGPGNIHLNDHVPEDSRYDILWSEVRWLQGAGIKVMIMVGGAAKGSWERLSTTNDEEVFPPPPF